MKILKEVLKGVVLLTGAFSLYIVITLPKTVSSGDKVDYITVSNLQCLDGLRLLNKETTDTFYMDKTFSRHVNTTTLSRLSRIAAPKCIELLDTIVLSNQRRQ